MTEQQQHPITPPEDLVMEWLNNMRSDDCIGAYPPDMDLLLATQAARWGADMELEACCEWLDQNTGRWDLLAELRAARRPKPKSQAEEALASLDGVPLPEGAWQAVSAALERLRELEGSNG